jgi:hypothetical protein
MNINGGDGGGDSRKNPAQLEREIDEERAHIRHTLDLLEGKLSPGEIFDRALDYTRRNGGEFSRNMVDTITHNPVATLMAATGIGWMLYRQNREASSYAPYRDSSESSLKDKASQVKASAEHAKRQAGDAAHRASESLRQGAEHVRDSTRTQARKVSQGFNHMLDEQPLALGALGLALGALIGGSLPSTRAEDRVMGETSDRVTDKVKQTAERTYDKAADAGREIKEDVKRDVREESRPAM